MKRLRDERDREQSSRNTWAVKQGGVSCQGQVKGKEGSQLKASKGPTQDSSLIGQGDLSSRRYVNKCTSCRVTPQFRVPHGNEPACGSLRNSGHRWQIIHSTSQQNVRPCSLNPTPPVPILRSPAAAADPPSPLQVSEVGGPLLSCTLWSPAH